jgi:ABC-type multidrug transport system ATPase subunit
MKILLNNAGKRFQKQWIFRNISTTLEQGSITAVTGINGSGKSTFIKTLANYYTPSEGTVQYFLDENEVAPENCFNNISMAAPYLELVEELSLHEMFSFQESFKAFVANVSFSQMAEKVNLLKAMHKPIASYSSGMKQRAKLALAFYANAPLLLLDEPTANLDEAGKAIYKDMLENTAGKKTIVIASNEPLEYQMATQVIAL